MRPVSAFPIADFRGANRQRDLVRERAVRGAVLKGLFAQPGSPSRFIRGTWQRRFVVVALANQGAVSGTLELMPVAVGDAP